MSESDDVVGRGYITFVVDRDHVETDDEGKEIRIIDAVTIISASIDTRLPAA